MAAPDKGRRRTTRIAFVAVMLVLLVVGGGAAIYYSGLARTPTATTVASTTSSSSPSIPPSSSSSSSSAPVYSYQVIETYPHDSGAFTEGLVYYNGSLYESTGLYGDSSLRRVDLDTGRVLQLRELPAGYFGEGITIFNGTVIQLTYQNDTAFVYDLQTFQLLRNFSFDDQGWGLTNDGTQLIMSDGTPELRFLDPQSFQVTGEITVRDGDTPIENLNSLAYINGSIFANVWLTNRIVVIDPGTGQVTASLDLTGIENLTGCHCDLGNDVLNGIAYDAQGHRLFVTGKEWPDLFQIHVVPPLPRTSSPLPAGTGIAAQATPPALASQSPDERERCQAAPHLPHVEVWGRAGGLS
ncbi:MAG: glutaminyl-peptide cyclotransferase [Nitrososphaerales archaeon]